MRATTVALLCLTLAALLAAVAGGAVRTRASAFIVTGSLGDFGKAAVSGSDDARASTSVAAKGVTVRDGSTAVYAKTSGDGTARASAVARSINLLDGLVTAYGARRTAHTLGATVYDGDVRGLRVGDRLVGDVTQDRGFTLPDDVGTLVVNHEGEAMRLTLSKESHGYPAGTSVAVAVVSASARRTSSGTTTRPGTRTPTPTATPDAAKQARKREARARRARARARRAARAARAAAAKARITAPGFGFPVFGEADVADDYGAARADTGKHQGNDIFAPFGAPVLAVADGTLNRVGTLPIAGNRLWLKTAQGDAFFYAHLSAFAAEAVNGRHVKAGAVLGFVGNTGDAEPTPPHVHFEIHPEDGSAIDPHPILEALQARGPAANGGFLARYGAEAGDRPGALVEIRDFIAEQ